MINKKAIFLYYPSVFHQQFLTHFISSCYIFSYGNVCVTDALNNQHGNAIGTFIEINFVFVWGFFTNDVNRNDLATTTLGYNIETSLNMAY